MAVIPAQAGMHAIVIPAQAGIHVTQPNMDPRFRGDDVVLQAVHCFLLSAFCSLFSLLYLTTIPTFNAPLSVGAAKKWA